MRKTMLVFMLSCLLACSLAAPAAARVSSAKATPTPDAPGLDASWERSLRNVIDSLRGRSVPQPTPQPTVAAADGLAAVRALPKTMHDDFEEDLGDWTNEFPATLGAVYEQGALILAENGPYSGWCLRQDDAAQVDDFLLEVDARHSGGPEYSFAAYLLFRYQDPDNYYLYEVDFGGRYMLERRDQGDWSSLVDNTEAGAIHTGENASNRLGVLAQDGMIRLFVNGTPLAAVADPGRGQGADAGFIGLGIGTDQERGVTVAFDQLDLWRIGAVPPTPEATATPVPSNTPARLPAVEDLPIDWRVLEEQFEISNRHIEEVLDANMAVPALFVYFDFEAVTEIGRIAFQAAFINDRAQVKDVRSVSFFPDPSVPADRYTVMGGWRPGVFGTGRFELPRDAAKYSSIRLMRAY